MDWQKEIWNIIAIVGAIYFLYALFDWYRSKKDWYRSRKKADTALIELNQLMNNLSKSLDAGELIDQRVDSFKQYEFADILFPDLSEYKPEMCKLIAERNISVDQAYDFAKALKEGASVPDQDSDELLLFNIESVERLVGSDRWDQHRPKMIEGLRDNKFDNLRDGFLICELNYKKEVADAAVANSWKKITGGRTQEETTEDMRSNFPSLIKEAEDGSSLAMMLVSMHYNSDTFPEEKNLKESFRWMEQAAHYNDSGAQHQVAYKYRDGVGVLQNYILAYMWFNIAILNCDPNDISIGTGESIRDSYVKERDELALKMTPAQIAESQAMANAVG